MVIFHSYVSLPEGINQIGVIPGGLLTSFCWTTSRASSATRPVPRRRPRRPRSASSASSWRRTRCSSGLRRPGVEDSGNFRLIWWFHQINYDISAEKMGVEVDLISKTWRCRMEINGDVCDWWYLYSLVYIYIIMCIYIYIHTYIYSNPRKDNNVFPGWYW